MVNSTSLYGNTNGKGLVLHVATLTSRQKAIRHINPHMQCRSAGRDHESNHSIASEAVCLVTDSGVGVIRKRSAKAREYLLPPSPRLRYFQTYILPTRLDELIRKHGSNFYTPTALSISLPYSLQTTSQSMGPSTDPKYAPTPAVAVLTETTPLHDEPEAESPIDSPQETPSGFLKLQRRYTKQHHPQPPKGTFTDRDPTPGFTRSDTTMTLSPQRTTGSGYPHIGRHSGQWLFKGWGRLLGGG